MGLSFPYNLSNGTTADAEEVQANFDEIKNNFDQDTIEDASASIAEFQATKLPDTGALPLSGREELKVLRYQIDAILGKTTWDEAPDTNLLLEFNKGADIASATALALGADGNYFDVTGTTAITSINTRRVGSVIKLHFDGILTLTHDGTDLILPGGANITTAAGDEAEFVEYAAGDWRCTNYSAADGEPVAGITTSHDHDGGDGAVIPQGGIKTAIGSVSTTTAGINLILPGGEYGFYPQVKSSLSSAQYEIGAVMSAPDGTAAPTAYVTNINLSNEDNATSSAQQRYIQASPPYKIGNKKWGHFLYMLVDTQGNVKAAYEAEDPPYAYNGPSQHKKDSIERIQAVPHPFPKYWGKDPAVDGLEIVLVDLRGHDTKKWKADNAKKGKGILEDLGSINKKGKIVTPQDLGIGNIQGFTDRVKIRKHN